MSLLFGRHRLCFLAPLALHHVPQSVSVTRALGVARKWANGRGFANRDIHVPNSPEKIKNGCQLHADYSRVSFVGFVYRCEEVRAKLYGVASAVQTRFSQAGTAGESVRDPCQWETKVFSELLAPEAASFVWTWGKKPRNSFMAEEYPVAPARMASLREKEKNGSSEKEKKGRGWFGKNKGVWLLC